MRKVTLAKKRRRLAKLLVPTFLVLYVLMIPLNSVLETEHSEVYPFFRWKLFANIPDWQTYEYALVIDAVDGQPIDNLYYLIPNSDIRDWKALRLAVSACTENIDCDDTVAEVLYPIIRRDIGEKSVYFSIFRVEIDLRDVQAHLAELADGRMARTDFYQLSEVVGRWNTETGRGIPSTAAG